MKIVLKGSELLKIGKGARNAHQLSLESKVSYATIYRYVHAPEGVMALDMKVFPAILINGCGLTREEFLNLRLGDLFNLEDADSPEA